MRTANIPSDFRERFVHTLLLFTTKARGTGLGLATARRILLFSMMLIVASLRLTGFFDWISERIIERLHPHHLLPTVIFTSGLLSAFLVNDIVCLVMTPFVLRMTRRLGLAPIPYVLAIATASNIGSVATITGNPKTCWSALFPASSIRPSSSAWDRWRSPDCS